MSEAATYTIPQNITMASPSDIPVLPIDTRSWERIHRQVQQLPGVSPWPPTFLGVALGFGSSVLVCMLTLDDLDAGTKLALKVAFVGSLLLAFVLWLYFQATFKRNKRAASAIVDEMDHMRSLAS